MANEELRFDIIGRDNASGAFSRVGGSVKEMSGKMDIATKSALILDEALKRQQTAARASVDATLALAKSDKILEEAEHTLARGALEAELALKREAEAKKKSGEAALAAAAKNEAFRKSIQGAADKAKGFGPGWLGLAAAVPVATSLTGVAAGAAVGLGGAAVAGAGALAAFGAVAKPVFADALKAEQAVQKAQDAYNVKIANGVKQASAYKAEQIAIGKAYAEMSPQQIALSKQLGAMSDAWSKLKAAETPVVAGALQPWLKSVTDLTRNLAPIIAAVSPVIKGLGTQFDTLVNSTAFTGFRDFIAKTGSKVVGAAGNAMIDLLTGMTLLLPQFTPLITGAANGISKWGDAFVRWSASQKAADQIHNFLAWFHQNGPVVGTLLKNVGAALAALAPGIGPASTAELNVISGFFAWIAKLPPSVAKPLVETAAVLLTLNKLGVFSVGVKIVGAAAGWVSKLLGGATVDVGAGGMQKAGDTMVGAAAAMQKAADTLAGGIAVSAEGGKAAAGAAGAAATGGLWSKILPGVKLVGGALVAAVVIDTVLKSTSSGPGGKNWLDNPFGQGVSKDPKTGKQTGTPTALTSWQTLGHDIMHDWDMTWNNTIARTQRGFHDVAGWFDKGRHAIAGAFSNVRHDVSSIWDTTWNNTVGRLNRGVGDSNKLLNGWWHNTAHWFDSARHDVSSIWDTTWNNTIGRLQRGQHDVNHWLDTMRHDIAGKFDNVRHDVSSIWDTVWNNTVGRARRGIDDAMRWIGGLPGKISNAFRGAGNWLWQKGSDIINGLFQGLKSLWNGASGVFSWFSGLPKKILGALGIKSPPPWAIDAGKHIMGGILKGLAHNAADVPGFFRGLAGDILGPLSGIWKTIGGFFGGGGSVPAASGSALQAQRYASSLLSMYHWGQDQMGPLIALWNQESGWNANAVNPSSGAYGIPQSLGHGHPYNLGDYANQVVWGLNYIRSTYGSPAAAEQHERQFNWYDSGYGVLPPGLSLSYNGTGRPEPLMPARGDHGGGNASGGNTYQITIHPTPLARPADIGREVVGAIQQYEKRSGSGWRK